MQLKETVFILLRSGFTYFVVLVIYLMITANSFHHSHTQPSDSINSGIIIPDSIISFAKKLSGINYKYGGIDEAGFDCSGFTCYVFKRHDIHIPRSSREQFSNGNKIEQTEIRKADLVFFKGRNKNSSSVGHVGIALSQYKENNVYFIHASSRSGIKIDSLTNPYYAVRYLGATRVIESDTVFLEEILP